MMVETKEESSFRGKYFLEEGDGLKKWKLIDGGWFMRMNLNWIELDALTMIDVIRMRMLIALGLMIKILQK